MVRLLLQYGANKALLNKCDMTPVQLADRLRVRSARARARTAAARALTVWPRALHRDGRPRGGYGPAARHSCAQPCYACPPRRGAGVGGR